MLLASLFIALWIAAPRASAQDVPARHGPRADGRGNRPRTVVLNNNAAGAAITSGNQIAYAGGAVLLGTTHVYYIWYGNWDASSIDILTNLANNIGGSPYYNINSGYFDGSGRSVSNAVSLGAAIPDNYSRGVSLRDRDIWTIVSNAISQGRLPMDSNGAYFVLTSADVALPGFPDTFCGWHSELPLTGTNIHFAFVGNTGPARVRNCARQSISPNGNAIADGMASSVAHELEEIATDPDLDAWSDSNGDENADKCAWTFGATYTSLNGSMANMRLGAKDYLIQQNWVNAGGGYCALSYTPGPDFALSPMVGQQTVAAGGATGNYTVAIIPVNGFSGSVNFSVSGLPAGATASALTLSATGASFSVATLGSLAGGTYPFTIVGSSGSLTRTAAATLAVSGASLAAVTLTIGTISPEPSQVGQTYVVGYSVTATPGTPTGNVTVTDGSASCTATVGAGNCILASATAGTKSISVAYSGNSQFAPVTKTTLHTVSSGGSLAHLAAGGGWETTFTLLNPGASAASIAVNLYGDAGGALNLPFTFPQGTGAPVNASQVIQSMASNSVLMLDTIGPGGQAFSAGWAGLSTAGSINGFEMLRYAPSGQEAAVPLETRNASSYVVLFDNTSLVNALGTGVGIANLGAQAQNVSFTIRDDAGTQIGNGSISLAALGHTAFTLSVQYPGTAGKRGTMEFFTPPGGQISVMALRSNGSAFTPIPVIARGSEGGGGMAHIVSGAGWRSIFSVVNTGAAGANISLRFFDDVGNPLALPLTILEDGSTLTAAQVTRTLAAGASLAIQAQGLDGQAAVGSAQLTTNGSASGFALLRYDPSGQEATVPLQSGNASAYLVPFDNSGILKIGVALANLASNAASIGVIVRDDMGAVLQTGTLSLPGNGHSAFVLDGNYPVSAGKRGTVEFDPVGGAQISVVGIRANGNFFTAVPVLAK